MFAGTAAAVLTTIVLIIRFCIIKYHIKKCAFSTAHLNNFLHAVIIGITVLVTAVPEGLPLAVTLALTYSVKKVIWLLDPVISKALR